MPFYSMSQTNVTLSTTNDSITIIAAANKRFKLHEVSIGAMGTVSAANEVMVSRSSSGITGGGAATVVPLVADSPAAATTNFTTWSAQPTLGNNVLRLPVNSNGGIYRWVAKPGSEPEWRNSDQLSVRSAVGTGAVSFHIIIEEI